MYNCDGCGKSFTRSDSILRHKKLNRCKNMLQNNFHANSKLNAERCYNNYQSSESALTNNRTTISTSDMDKLNSGHISHKYNDLTYSKDKHGNNGKYEAYDRKDVGQRYKSPDGNHSKNYQKPNVRLSDQYYAACERFKQGYNIVKIAYRQYATKELKKLI